MKSLLQQLYKRTCNLFSEIIVATACKRTLICSVKSLLQQLYCKRTCNLFSEIIVSFTVKEHVICYSEIIVATALLSCNLFSEICFTVKEHVICSVKSLLQQLYCKRTCNLFSEIIVTTALL